MDESCSSIVFPPYTSGKKGFRQIKRISSFPSRAGIKKWKDSEEQTQTPSHSTLFRFESIWQEDERSTTFIQRSDPNGSIPIQRRAVATGRSTHPHPHQ